MHQVFVPLASTNLQNDNTALHFARETYIKALVAQGLLPVFVSPLFSSEMISQIRANCSGLLLMGGSDINSQTYHQPPHPNTKAPEPMRDELEIDSVKWAMADKIPILAICRGAQVLNVALGGNLIQHLPDYVTNESHFPVSNPPETYNHLFDSPGHQITVNHHTLAANIFGANATVNSYHHQAIKCLGDHLLTTAHSPQGVIEIIEGDNIPSHFIFATQFHPEAMDSTAAIKLFSQFASRVKTYQPKISLAKS